MINAKLTLTVEWTEVLRSWSGGGVTVEGGRGAGILHWSLLLTERLSSFICALYTSTNKKVTICGGGGHGASKILLQLLH